jgi:hypothetical protein
LLWLRFGGAAVAALRAVAPGNAEEDQGDECKDFNCNILSHGMLIFWNNKVCRVTGPDIGLKIGKDFFFDIIIKAVQ